MRDMTYKGPVVGSAIVWVTRSDVEAIEEAGDCAIRCAHIQTALKLYALALRLRSETGFHPLRRAGDEPST